MIHRAHLPIAPLFALVALLTAPRAGWAADAWNLPLELNDANTSIAFEVDSTWHTVHGRTKGVSGSLSLADRNDPRSIRGEISLPVAQFDTDSSRRDGRMREVMAADRFPVVTYKLSGIETECDPHQLPQNTPCSLTAHGTLSIRGTAREWSIPATIERNADSQYHLRGESVMQWKQFGVEDPSILVARLAPDVTIFISIHWNTPKEE